MFFYKLDIIGLISITLYFVVIFLSLKGIKYYAIFLIFIILAFPANINNYLPSILFSSPLDLKKIYYPIITHIDVFLLLGIIKYYDFTVNKFKRQNQNKPSILIIIGIVLLFILSIIFNVRLNSLSDITLIVSNAYHIRYFFLIFLLTTKTQVFRFKNELFIGLMFSIIFLIVESIIYSLIYDTARLTSGSLKVNTFANIFSAITCYYTFLIIRNKVSKKYLLLIFFMLLTIYLTKTRSALFLFCFYFLIETLVYILRNIRQKQTKKVVLILIVTVLLMMMLYWVTNSRERLSLKNFKIEKIDLDQNELNKIIIFDKNKFTESLTLRLNHFQTSINMIKESPVFGIGPGMWNKYKSDYGSKEVYVMDSHNDLLASMSQYGIIQGIILCFSIYYMPFVFFKKRNKTHDSPLNYLFIISIFMMFAGFTNAGLFKHQVFGFLVLIVMISAFNRKDRTI